VSYTHCVYNLGVAEVRHARWNLRIGSQTDLLVRRAASERDQSLTDFVVESALTEAEHVLADRTRFERGEQEWRAFMDLLDRPVQDNPGLAKLFNKPSVFE
jgi:uncharacterized protein (DUF1778 family)